MTKDFLTRTLILAATILAVAAAPAQESTPALTPVQIEAGYTEAITKRTADILGQLELSDEAKSNKVTEIIIRQYRALRSRDEVIGAALGDETSGTDAQRANLFQSISKPLHDRFLAKLAAELTPAQVEKVKDRMTYNRLKLTYDNYCAMVTNLTDADKAKILEMLKAAREVAMDAGSSSRKAEIFQECQEKLDDYLTAHGHDMAKARTDWNAKQDLAKKQ